MKKAASLSELGFDSDGASSSFFRPVSDVVTPTAHRQRLTKVSVIGAGNVGMAIAQTILTRDLADEIALVDALPDKLRGEMLDLQHAAAFLPRTRLVSDTDMAVTKGSDLAIVTAGARQIPGETRLNLLQRNVALFRKIVPALAEQPTAPPSSRPSPFSSRPPIAMDVSESSTASEDKLYRGEALAEAGEEGTSSGLVHLIPSPNQVDKQPMIARERSKGPRAVTYEEDLADKKAAVQLAHHTAIDVEALEGIRSGSFSARPASARTPSSRPWRSSSSGTASRRSTSRPLPPPGGHSSARLQPSSGDITVLQTWSTLDAGLFAFDMGVMVGILPQIKGVIRSWETAPKVAFGVTAGMAVGLLAMGLMTAKYRLDPKMKLGKLSAFCARFSTLLSTALFIVTTACEFGSIGCKAGAIYAAVVVIIMIGFWVYEELSAEEGVSNFWSRGKPAAAAQTVQRTSSHTETKP